MFEGERTAVFWVGLVILSLSSVVLFSIVWYVAVIIAPYASADFYWRILVPPIVGTLVFILIGLYMMTSGTRKEKEPSTRLL